MELSRKVKASRTHVAKWFDCTHDEAVRHFGVSIMNNLVSGIRNGVTSTSNQSERISNGSNEFVTVTLTISLTQGGISVHLRRNTYIPNQHNYSFLLFDISMQFLHGFGRI
jgi:hypothetical protein